MSNEFVFRVRILYQAVVIVIRAYYVHHSGQEAKAPRQSIPRKEAQIAIQWVGADFILYMVAHATLLK